MEMGFIPQLATVGAGGVVAAIADRKFADKAVTIGPVTFTVGAMGSAAGLLALGLFGGRSLPWTILGHALQGSIIYEVTTLGEAHVTPLLEKFFPGWLPGVDAPTEELAGEDYVSGYLETGLPDEYDLDRGLCSLRSMC